MRETASMTQRENMNRQPPPLDLLRAHYDLLKVSFVGSAKWVFLADLSNYLDSRTVTNDAERVVREVHFAMSEAGKTLRILYRDTMDSWCELVHDEGRFTGFKPLAVGVHPELPR
jgi:hypothetical protein